ncbi:Piezo non-specific cation channel, R-Ras-binding domain protein [Artemisia annua]|uniref:Piezo non-specific cation channel, R-Ras-binding domain protein n=1 Tax=Artemisia annua TaxID=35608 RepID=A0A2U1Q1W5_ARTAN|nr:Piezo non-specific cation channel, R-Ras-binding domain protein [Artemisia annua]
MNFIMSTRDSNLSEQLLPSTNSFFIRESRSGERDTNLLLRGPVFRTFSINFFTYGAPVSLFALSLWSFYFASVCAFGLLGYVGYIIFAFPSLFRLHRLNGLLLVFILLWAVSTYIFNIAFAYLNGKLGKDTKVWEMVGLWHYSFPGFFILAQFFLGVLVALVNLVNNSVFLYISDEAQHTSSGDPPPEGLLVCSFFMELLFCKCVRIRITWICWLHYICFPILVSFAPAKWAASGLHSLVGCQYIYIQYSFCIPERETWKAQFFLGVLVALVNLVNNSVFLYISDEAQHTSSGDPPPEGLLETDSSWNFAEIALLACFCAIHKHGHKVLFSFSAIVQHTPCPPVGFSILKAGLNKSVLLSVYAYGNTADNNDHPSQERKVASYLSAIGQKFLSIYRSLGTYIAFVTILITVYMTRPNFVSFGYLFLLIFWISGRQLFEKTKKRLWFPLKVYSIVMFILIYILSIFPSFKEWVSTKVDLYAYLGYNSEGSIFENVSESLAITIAMQLYSYERRQNRYPNLEDTNRLQFGVTGFIRRLLIWHSQKILFFAMFHASISPISLFGLVYLLGAVFCSILPKASRVPSKTFLVYSGFLATLEYLFQLCGGIFEMFPGQKHSGLSNFLGLKVYQSGAWGLEAGLRSKVLVIAACTLQYNVFHWLEMMPSWLSGVGQWEEPCPLFFSQEDVLPTALTPNGDNVHAPFKKLVLKNSNSWPANNQELEGQPELAKSSNRRYMLGYFLGEVKENHKWKKKQVNSLRKERFEMQKTSLKIYLKFWMENMFILFGLEINMIALLLASFALLNAISLLYIASLAACVVLGRRLVQRSWSLFVVLFASILLLEYFAIWKTEEPFSAHGSSESDLHCHDCWRISEYHFSFCRRCWLGLTVDDPRVLISYFLVFMFACFKLRADQFCSFSGSYTYRQMISQRKNAFVWRDLSLETKTIWTLLDYLRLYCYCHMLDLVLALILITGTLEYDILHLGYLAFALSLFRLRLTILKKKNKIFKWLRIYNFMVIVLSLAYQSPFISVFNEGKCETIDYVYEVIGFYKYDYGFRITSRSALVEIIIFILVSLQSYMFSSPELNYVFQYLEAEQIGAIVREQEKKAAWKTEQLQHIREDEEKKLQRNMQVEKMKSEMLSLQIQLYTCTAHGHGCSDDSPRCGGLRRRRGVSLNTDAAHPKEEVCLKKQESEIIDLVLESRQNSHLIDVPEFEEDVTESERKDNGTLISAVQLLGDGVSQVQSIGNRAVSEIAIYLFTLIQSSITAKDSEWIFSTDFSTLTGNIVNPREVLFSSSWGENAQKMLHLASNIAKLITGNCLRYWKSLTQAAESPPYFIQISLDVHSWPDYGIQPARVESGVNELLRYVHNCRCKESDPTNCPCASTVQVRSIEKSKDSPNVALAVFEVTYVSPRDECSLSERYKSLTPAADVAKEITEAQDVNIYKQVEFPYSIISVIGGAIFYQSVIKNENEFLDVYQLEDQFPKEAIFLWVNNDKTSKLSMQAIFFLIVVDRVLYLCSFATGKVIFYIINLVIFTYTVTEYAWSMEPSQHNAAGFALRAIYLTKSISFALQAIQIRSGVPHKSTLYRQFLTSSISTVNYMGYRLYRALPFLYELRCVLDWSCTTTSLTMYDWLKLEDINASLYLVKSDAVLNRADHRQGQKQRKVTKFCNGLCLFIILICVIWAPMLMYSSGNPTNIANPINDASVQFYIKTNGGRLMLYETTLCAITPWNVLQSSANLDPYNYLESYNVADIQMICCQADAISLWIVPDVIQRRYIQSLDMDMDMKFSWVLTRDRPKNKEVVKFEQTIQRSDLPQPSELERVLNGSSNSFRINNTYPRYFRVTGSGDVRVFDQKEGGVDAELLLNRGNSTWWSFYDISWLESNACGDLMGPMAIVVSEETPQGLLGETLSKSSIWGLYITFVLAVGRFIRFQCSDLRMRIPFENLPSCDRLIAICEDIYAARAEGELVVEEVLYWTLVKIYRSPHMLLEYTNPD